jgi:hypothetical protein
VHFILDLFSVAILVDSEIFLVASIAISGVDG